MPSSIKQTQTQTPSQFICALTNKIMKEPMLSRYGHHYERTAIVEYLNEGNTICPMTQQPLRPSQLITDKNLKTRIQTWRKLQKEPSQAAQAENPAVSEEEKDGENDSLPASNIQVIAHCAIPPAHFICPLTGQVMKDPVMAKTGVNYERAAILNHLRKNQEYKCPITGRNLTPSNLVANVCLHYEIQQWHMAPEEDLSPVSHEQPLEIVTKNSSKEQVDSLAWGYFSVGDLLEEDRLDNDENVDEDVSRSEDVVGAVVVTTKAQKEPLAPGAIPTLMFKSLKTDATNYMASYHKTSGTARDLMPEMTITMDNVASAAAAATTRSSSATSNKGVGQAQNKEQLVDVLDNVIGILGC